MPRFLLGNFDFEHQLSAPGRQPSRALLQLCADRASVWLAVADDGDYLWSPLPVDPTFSERLEQARLPRVIPVEDFSRVPAGTEFVPWGVTAAGTQLARRHGWQVAAPDPQIVREVNSRQFSFSLETACGIGLERASMITSRGEVAAALAATGTNAVIKANFGMSARERILIRGELTASQRAWIEKRLVGQRVLFVEPWVEQLEEVGIQIEIPPHGEPSLAGLTPLLSDQSGQYRGSWFGNIQTESQWSAAIEHALSAARQMQRLGYFGPVGIDAMRYRDHDRKIRLRPLQDINARWTMGRLSLGWRRWLNPGENGCWLHQWEDDESCPTSLRSIEVPCLCSPQVATKVMFFPSDISDCDRVTNDG